MNPSDTGSLLGACSLFSGLVAEVSSVLKAVRRSGSVHVPTSLCSQLTVILEQLASSLGQVQQGAAVGREGEALEGLDRLSTASRRMAMFLGILAKAGDSGVAVLRDQSSALSDANATMSTALKTSRGSRRADDTAALISACEPLRMSLSAAVTAARSHAEQLDTQAALSIPMDQSVAVAFASLTAVHQSMDEAAERAMARRTLFSHIANMFNKLAVAFRALASTDGRHVPLPAAADAFASELAAITKTAELLGQRSGMEDTIAAMTAAYTAVNESHEQFVRAVENFAASPENQDLQRTLASATSEFGSNGARLVELMAAQI